LLQNKRFELQIDQTKKDHNRELNQLNTQLQKQVEQGQIAKNLIEQLQMEISEHQKEH